MNEDKPKTVVWWLEVLRAIIAALAGLLGSTAI